MKKNESERLLAEFEEKSAKLSNLIGKSFKARFWAKAKRTEIFIKIDELATEVAEIGTKLEALGYRFDADKNEMVKA